MNQHQYETHVNELLQLVSSLAIKRFDSISPVRRVAMKVNPAIRGQFLFLVTLTNGQRFEGRTSRTPRLVDWCDTPNCNCMGFARTRSPLEAGATIDD